MNIDEIFNKLLLGTIQLDFSNNLIDSQAYQTL